MESIGQRLKLVRGDIRQEDLAADLGVHKNTYAGYERGASLPDSGFLVKFLERFPGLNPTWLLTGRGCQNLTEYLDVMREETYRDLSIWGVDGAGREALNDSFRDFLMPPCEPKPLATDQHQQRLDDKFSYIPLYEVNASAGGGAFNDSEEVTDFLAFKTEWIRVSLQVSPQDLRLIHVLGDSMEPTLRPGDVIMVQRIYDMSRLTDGIYVMLINGTLLVKRLQCLPNDKIRISSDNPAYEPFVIESADMDADLTPVGRVVWCGRRM